MVQGWGIAGSAGRWTLAGCGAALLLAIALLAGSGLRAEGAGLADGTHLGVGSCARSTCHGRQEPTGAVVRQDEIQRWQDESSPAGAHSRAWRVLGGARGRSIAARLGIGDPAQLHWADALLRILEPLAPILVATAVTAIVELGAASAATAQRSP